MASLSGARLSLGVEDVSRPCSVPRNDVARLMYYLSCVLRGCKIDIIEDKLLDYENYTRLTTSEADSVFLLAFTFSPDELLGKVIFLDDGTLRLTKTNHFFDVTAVANVLSIQREAIIGGEIKSISRIMVFKQKWLESCYLNPMKRNQGRLQRILTSMVSKHCSHCKGEHGECACSECPRKPHSQCTRGSTVSTLTRLLLQMSTNLSDDHCAHCRGREGICACEHGCPKGESKCIVKHEMVLCDSCKSDGIVGVRYKCADCNNYDLCSTCYLNDKHELTHPFLRIDRPGTQGVLLQPRKKPHLWHGPSKSPPRPTEGQKETPPAASSTERSMKSLSDIHRMSISEMKSYLQRNQVSLSGVLERSELRRRVWKTQIDSMSAAELEAFVQEYDISTHGCTDVAARRTRAKQAYREPRPAQPAASTLRNGQRVKLVGLKGREDLNGRMASVVNVRCGQGRVELKIDGMDKSFAVRFENVEVCVDVLD